MKLNKKKNGRGFTTIELLVVVIVIIVLTTLVLKSYKGVQLRARDSERRSDINYVASQLETYYNNNGAYPQFAGQVNSDSWLKDNFKNTDLDKWRPPNDKTNSMVNSATPDKTHYGYRPLQDNGTTACSATPCAKFKLYWYQEKDTTVQSKDSLN